MYYSLNQKQIKLIKSLHLKKYRQEHQLFLLEGEKLVNEALRDKPEIIQWIIIKNDYSFSTKLSEVYTVSEKIFHSLTTLSSPEPIMSVCKFLAQQNSVIADLTNTFSFYLDNINDPGNLGTIIRVCDWFGIPQIFCSPNTVELYNPKTIQASKGSFLRVHLNYIELEQINFPHAINLYATDSFGTNIHSIKDKTGLIILGNESHGVSPKIKNKAHQNITIPKYLNSKAESLNVAMSASIIASEFFKV